MAAGGGAPSADVIGINVVIFGVGAEPPNSTFAVLDLSGERGFISEAVINCNAEIPVLGEWDDFSNTCLLASTLPSPAVNKDNGWHWFDGRAFWADDIECERFVPAFTVFHVAYDFDIGWDGLF